MRTSLFVAMGLCATVAYPTSGQIINGTFDDGSAGWTLDVPAAWPAAAFPVVGGSPGHWADLRSSFHGAEFGRACLEQVIHCGPDSTGPTCQLRLDYFLAPRDASKGGARMLVELDGALLFESDDEFFYGPRPFRTVSLAIPGGTHELSLCLDADLGAGGWQLGVDSVDVETPCAEDITGDQVVAFGDLLAVLDGWGVCAGACPTYCQGDVNRDCRVNVTDLVQVITGWGACPAGACCLESSCESMPWQDCVAAGGVFLGGGVACDEATCAPDPCAETAVCFLAGDTLPVGADPRSITLADLNGDDALDLVTADIDSDSVSVRLGHGDGTFGPLVLHAAGSSPYGVTAADLDGDGAPDLVTAQGVGNAVGVLWNNGNGTFGAQATYPAAVFGRAVAIADLNGDGLPDLAVAADGLGAELPSLSISLNRGDRTFGPRTVIETDRVGDSVEAGDLDGDGDTDLVVAHSHGSIDDYVGIYWNDGAGGIEGTSSVPMGGYAYARRAILGDLDGDADLDMLAIGGDAGVFVVLNDGTGVFTIDGVYTTGVADPSHSVGMRGSALADFDGDGDLDAVATNFRSEVWVLLNDGDGVLVPDSLHYVVGSPYSVAAGDLDGDGKPDFAAALASMNDVQVLLNR